MSKKKIMLGLEGGAVVKTDQGDELVQVIFKPLYMSFSEYADLVACFVDRNNSYAVTLSVSNKEEGVEDG